MPLALIQQFIDEKKQFNCCETKLILIIFRWLLKSCLLSNQYPVDYDLSMLFSFGFFPL